MAPRLFVTLAGNIGAGKTTAAELLSTRLGYQLFCEPVVDNRFLRAYYGDMKRWSFTLQMEFLIKRIEHHAEIEHRPAHQVCVQDRSLIEDPEVFAKYLHGLGNMTDDELALYYDYFQRLNAGARQPDRVILLHTPDVQVLLRRIAERGREEERGITASFLRGLNAYYETFAEVAQRKYGLDVLVVDVTNLDIRQEPGRTQFIEQCVSFLERPDARGTLL